MVGAGRYFSESFLNNLVLIEVDVEAVFNFFSELNRSIGVLLMIDNSLSTFLEDIG